MAVTNVFDLQGLSPLGSRWESSKPEEEVGTQGAVEIWGVEMMQVKAITIFVVGSLQAGVGLSMLLDL